MSRRIFLSVLGLAVCLGAASVNPVSAAATTQPTDTAKVESLMKQLGDDQYCTRATADRELRKMGPGILPQLEAAKDLDPEAQTRLDDIIHSLWRREGKIMPTEDWLEKRPKLARDFSGRDPSLLVNIHEDADGIEMTYTAKENGVLVERHAAGLTPQAIRDADSNAFAAYWSVRGQTDQTSPEVIGFAKSEGHATTKVAGHIASIADPDAVMRRELDNPDLSVDQRQAIEKAIAGAAANRKHDGSPNVQ